MCFLTNFAHFSLSAAVFVLCKGAVLDVLKGVQASSLGSGERKVLCDRGASCPQKGFASDVVNSHPEMAIFCHWERLAEKIGTNLTVRQQKLCEGNPTFGSKLLTSAYLSQARAAIFMRTYFCLRELFYGPFGANHD